ncbi:MAG: hypothetical protein ACREGL_09460 [Alphaproteobacteria bacterium]
MKAFSFTLWAAAMAVASWQAASENYWDQSVQQHNGWIRSCSGSSISVRESEDEDLILYSVELPSDGDGIVRCLLSGRDVIVDDRAAVTYHSPFDNVVNFEDGPERPMLEALLRTERNVLIVSGARSDYGVLSVRHVSGNTFIVQTGYATHNRNHLVFADTAESRYLVDGDRVEVADKDKLIFRVEDQKSYFKPAGAFWFDALIDSDGEILDIVTPGGDCMDLDELRRRSSLDLSRVARSNVCVEW